MNRVQKAGTLALKIISSFILCFSACVLAVVTILSFTFFSESYMLKVMEKNQYYGKVSDALLLKSSKFFDNAGIMQQMLPTMINEETIRNEIEYNTNAIFNGTILRANKDEEFNQLRDEVLSSLQAGDVEITPEIVTNINMVIQQSKNAYLMAVTIPYYNQMVVWISGFKGVARLILLALSIVFGVGSWVSLRNLCTPKEQDVYVQCGLLGAGLTLFAPATVLLATGWSAATFNSNRIFIPLVQSYLNGVFLAFAVVGALLLAVGVAYGFLAAKFLHKEKHSVVLVEASSQEVLPVEQQPTEQEL